jgi:predicted MFS family arabinose efflux permease
VLGASKVAYDVSLGAWVADHVPWNRRSAVVGFTEISWALGLLVGVSAMGLVTAATDWRYAYVLAALVVLVLAFLVSVRLPKDDDVVHQHADDIEIDLAHGVLRRGSWYAIASCFTLMGAIQCIFVTFGPWLEDTFGYTEANIAAVGFLLGAVELTASLSSSRFTDSWGKQRSVALGAGLMVPAALLVVVIDDRLVPAMVGLAVMILGFEFGIVSLLPIGAQLVPGRRGRGMGLLIGAGTLGRACVSVAATQLYDRHGIPPAAMGTALLACGTVALVLMHARVTTDA